MKFGRNLPRNQVPEWASSYINYKALKKLIKSAEASAKSTGDADLIPFFYALDRNLEVVDTFYNKKYGEASRRLRLLQNRYGSLTNLLDVIDDAEASELLDALLEARGQLRNLQWYGEVNRRGFVKITKKLDKKLPNICAQKRYMESRVDGKVFANNSDLTAAMKLVNEAISSLGDFQKRDLLSQDDNASEKFAPHLPSSFTAALDPHFRLDNADGLERELTKALHEEASFLSEDLDQNAVLLSLLQRAISCRARTCMTFLLSRIESLDESGDINGRNCIHRLVIAIGRANSTGDNEEVADMVLHSELDDSEFITPAATPTAQPQSVRSRQSRNLLSINDSLVQLLQHLLGSLSTSTQRGALRSRDSYGRSPLHYAAQYGFVIVCTMLMQEMVKWKLVTHEVGFDHQKWQDSEGWAPIHIAVIEGHPLTVRALLGLDQVNVGGTSTCSDSLKLGMVLSLAVKANFVAIVQSLLDAGANHFYQDSEGETALHVAARFGHSDCTRIILDHCTDEAERFLLLETPEKTFSWTPLFIAAVDGHQEVSDLLCSYGADGDRKDLSGWSCREHAALRGHLELARSLAEHAASNSNKTKCETVLLSISPGSTSSIDERTSAAPRTAFQQLRTSEPVKAFGHRYLKNESLVLVSLGSMDARKSIEPVKLDRIPIANAHSTQLDTALSVVVSATGAMGEPTVIDLPVQDSISTEPIVLTSKDPSNVRLLFDIIPTYAGSNTRIVGRGVALLDSVKQSIGDKRINLQGDISVPIVAADNLDIIGTVHFNFLIITPFSHPNMKISENKTYWKSLASTMVIGHRGLGKNILSRKSLQLGENTIQSFIAAANLGANYIEFDVQLTKDHVPVIYHDFLVSETGIDAPVHTLTLEQFLHVGEVATPRNSRPPTPPNAADRRLDIIKDLNKRGRSLSVGDRYDDTVAGMSERMKHTRDFKKKGFKGNSRGAFIKDKFTTLDEMFEQVPLGTGFNIEMKYPMLFETEQEEMDAYAIDLNTFVDTVLSKVYEKNVGSNARDIIFSSFNPDICLLLSFKQPSIPVLFLTDAGTAPVGDIRASSLQEAIRFASRWNLLGVVTAVYPLIVAPRLIRVVKETGLVCISYGVLNNDPVNVQIQADQEIDAVIVDSLVTVREGLRTNAASKPSKIKNEQGDTATPPAVRSKKQIQVS